MAETIAFSIIGLITVVLGVLTVREAILRKSETRT